MSQHAALNGLTGSQATSLKLLLSHGRSGLDERQWNTLIGIVTAIVGNILISFALNLQRYAHIRINRERAAWELRSKSALSPDYGTRAKLAEERLRLNLKRPGTGGFPIRGEYDENTPLRDGQRLSDVSNNSARLGPPEDDGADQGEQSKNYLKSPWWWAGIVLMTTGEAGNFLAYGFAPASIVSPLGVVALISNCIIAPCLLKERFRQRDFWGVFVAITGVVILVLSAKDSENRMGPKDIWSSITRWEFELYLGLTAAAMLLLSWASSKYGDRTILIDIGLVALFGGYTALSTKGIASLLSDSLWLALTFPVTYLLIFILVATAILQIRYLNRALSRFDSTQVIPTQFVMFTISVIVGSAVLYRDFESADGERIIKFLAGCFLTFVGVYFITSGRGSDKDSQDFERGADEEQEIGLIDDEDQDNESARASSSSSPTEEVPNAETQWTNSRRSSRHAGSRSSHLERLGSSRSYMSRPFTPPSPGPGSPLVENPWANPREGFQSGRFSSQNTTTSSLPAEGSQPTTPKGSRRAYMIAAERLSASHRRSIADIFPGPISSPLSSSFSGVVASKRKELDTPSKPRRPGLGLARTTSKLHARQSEDNLQHNPPSTESMQPMSRQRRARSHSLGHALGSFFHRHSKTKRDEEQGRSGDSRGEGNDG